MTHHARLVALFLALANPAAAAAPTRPVAPRPPSAPIVTLTPRSDCIDSRNSADYVAGVSVDGHAVPPADLPGTANAQISTEIYPLVNTKNPQAPTVGVVANLPGLATRPSCVSPRPSASPVKR